MELIDWAYGVAERNLSKDLPRRWMHVKGVAGRARSLRSFAGSDAELLEASAVLHDIGYAPRLAVTGFHPLDGAIHLVKLGASPRLAGLVAHHSCAVLEARLRGVIEDLKAFADEGGPIRDALWYCDLTTSPDGLPVSVSERLAEIQRRYGPGHLVSRFVDEASEELLGAVDRTEQRLKALA